MGTRGYLNYLLYRRGKLGEEWTISRTDPFAYLFTEGTTSAEWLPFTATGGP
jgi:hypothetical protein